MGKDKEMANAFELLKIMQARIVEACLKSTLLFNSQVRTWQLGEAKQLQTMDRMYRYIWSKKKSPPLIQMQNEQKKGVKSVRQKVEKRFLE